MMSLNCGYQLAYCSSPRVHMRIETRWNNTDSRSRRTRRKTCPNAAFSTTNPTYTKPGANPGLRCERRATNRLSHAMTSLSNGRVVMMTTHLRLVPRLKITGFILAATRTSWAVPWLRSLVAGLSPQRPGFAPGSIHLGFVMDKVALGKVFLRVLRFSPVNISFHRRSPNLYHLGNA
jgi:hypothetical protein